MLHSTVASSIKYDGALMKPEADTRCSIFRHAFDAGI